MLKGVGGVRSYVLDELRPYVLGIPDTLSSIAANGIYICTIGSGAAKASATHLVAEGDTRCTSIANFPDPDVAVQMDGALKVIDFLRGNERLNSATVVGNGVIGVRRDMYNSMPGQLAKTKYHTNLVLPNQPCLGGDCAFTWVELPNKNPNTGTSQPCSLPAGQLFSARLDCELDSRPYNQLTLD